MAVTFEARVGNAPFSCTQSYNGLGTTATTFTPIDLRLYIHDLRLITDSGAEVPLELGQDGPWQYRNVALLDFEDKTGSCQNGTAEVNTVVRGRAAPGSYRGVHFNVGVPFELNHEDLSLAPSPLNLSTMFWAWNSGYKFVRIEGSTSGLPFVALHLGSTGCVGGNAVTGCARPNRPDVVVDGMDPTSQAVIVDLAGLFAAANLDDNVPGTPGGCMSDPTDGDCVGMFRGLGLRLDDGLPDPATPQTLFRAP